MAQRLDYPALSQNLFNKYLDFNTSLHTSETVNTYGHLVTIYASQLNGCAFCVDMHVKEAKIHGERELRIYHICVWRESPLFDEREKAVLLWTEELTRLDKKGVSDEVYETVRKVFTEKEVSDLTFLIVAINGWNRLGVAFRKEPGSADVAYGLNKSGLN